MFVSQSDFHFPTDGKSDPTNERDVMNRGGLLYFFAVSVFMESVNPCVLTFPVDKAVFLREENAKLYRSFSYFIGKLIIDIITNFPLPILDTVIGKQAYLRDYSDQSGRGWRPTITPFFNKNNFTK